MRIISFAWTTPALLAWQKSCTRRDWNDLYAWRFHKDEMVQAYNRSPRFSGQLIALIRLTHRPYKEPYCQVPASDWEAEGFAYLESIGATVNGMTPRQLWEIWKQSPLEGWVIRFEIIQIEQKLF